MKTCSSTSIILKLLALFATTRAAGNWTIDYESCQSPGSFFILNEYALILASAIQMNDNLNAPSQTTDTLVQYMFGTAQQGYDPISFPQVVFGGGGPNNILGLANFAANEAEEDEDLGDGDFKIFCDSLHLVPPNPDHGYVNWYDSFSGVDTADPTGEMQSCLDGKPTPGGLEPPNAMRISASNGQGRSSIIFCRWYFNEAMTAAYPDGRNFNSNYYTRMTAWWANNQMPQGMAQIDVFRLFDSLFKHELIHTPAAGFKHDVAGMASYGWNHARTLSTNTDPITGCQSNVDNFVELDLANKLSGIGYTVNQDGSLSL